MKEIFRCLLGSDWMRSVISCGLGIGLVAEVKGGQEDWLYRTSFENAPMGGLSSWGDGDFGWSGDGVEVQSKIAHEGKVALRLLGGQGRWVMVALAGESRRATGVEFFAERWTGKSPFRLVVEVQVDGDWQELRDLSAVVRTGKNISQKVVLRFPEGKLVTGVRWRSDTPEETGVLLDDFALLRGVVLENVGKIAKVPFEKIELSQALFVSGDKVEGVVCDTFRIPVIVTAKNGDLLAVADARYQNSADLIQSRSIDIVMRRSKDHGKSWSPVEKIASFGVGRPVSDASLVVHQKTGEIFCFYNSMDQDRAKGEFRHYVQKSSDHGQTWGAPVDITDSLVQAGWGKKDFHFMTSGRACSTRDGRILHTLVHLKLGVFVMVSEDDGKSWKTLPVVVKPADESKIIELADGSWMINSRVNGAGVRWVHRSVDQGKSWVSEREWQLIDPSCNASILPVSLGNDVKREVLLFLNANSGSGRKNLAMKVSEDAGRTWSEGEVVDPNDSAYSEMTVQGDGAIGVLYEPGYREIRYKRLRRE